jgi:hypothetical protein
MFWHSYFPNVMDDPGTAKRNALILRQPETLCHGHGEIG